MMQLLERLLTSKYIIFISCFVVSTIIYWNVSSLYDGNTTYSTSSSDAVYVMEDIDIDFRYDTSKYEVVSFVNKPYVVIKGNKAAINKMKWSKEKPTFFIDLTGKLPGTYQEVLQYTNIPSNLTVEIYPLIIDLRIMEQQTLSFTPQVELEGSDTLGDNYIVSVPELERTEVRVKGMQSSLNSIGQIKGVVDIKGSKTSVEEEITLKAYDRDGNVIDNVTILEPKMKVMIPISKKVTIINENIINKIVVVTGTKEKDIAPKVVVTESKDSVGTSKEDAPKDVTKPETPTKETVKPKGSLVFINTPSDLLLENMTQDLEWQTAMTVDLKTFKVGTYEMALTDGNSKKVVKFKLTSKTQDTDKPKDEVNSESEDSEDVHGEGGKDTDDVE